MTALALKPLGHRVLVDPDPTTETTASGFIIPGAVHVPKMSGTVRAVGNGPARDAKIRAATIARCRRILDDAEVESSSSADALTLAREELARYLRQSESPDPMVQPGDRVVFAAESGFEIVMNEHDDSVIVLTEDDVLAVVQQHEERPL